MYTLPQYKLQLTCTVLYNENHNFRVQFSKIKITTSVYNPLQPKLKLLCAVLLKQNLQLLDAVLYNQNYNFCVQSSTFKITTFVYSPLNQYYNFHIWSSTIKITISVQSFKAKIKTSACSRLTQKLEFLYAVLYNQKLVCIGLHVPGHTALGGTIWRNSLGARPYLPPSRPAASLVTVTDGCREVTNEAH